MGDMAVHFSSATDEWETPQDFFDELDEEFEFALDVCATPENAKAPYFFTRTKNGLLQPWAAPIGHAVWMNPPYGRGIGKWVEKARHESERGATVVCLLPARTDTRWFHDHIHGRAEIRFVRGRLKFGGHKNSAPFPSMVVVFRPTERTMPARFDRRSRSGTVSETEGV